MSLTIKKAEHQRTDAFELWYWRRLLRVPWTSRRSNQSILKDINPEYSLEGLMLKLKLQLFRDPHLNCSLPGSSVHEVSQARKYYSGLPFSPPRDLPDPGMEPLSPALAAAAAAKSLQSCPTV